MKSKLTIELINGKIEIKKQLKHDDFYKSPQLEVFVRGNGFWKYETDWLSAKKLAKSFQNGSLNLNDVDGTFLILFHDKEKKQVLIFTDHLNFFPIYKSERHGIYLSDTLANHGTQLSEHGVLQYMTLGTLLGESTLLEKTVKLPGASQISINYNGEISSKTYWKCSPINTTETQFKSIFKSTLKQITLLSKRPTLTLTAGLDSRMIFSQLIKNQTTFDCFTFGHPKSPDIRIASKIASDFNLKHNGYNLDSSNIRLTSQLENLFNENLFYTDGMINSLKSIHTNFCFSDEAEDHDMVITATGELVYSHYAEVPTLFRKNNSSIESIANFLIEFNLNKVSITKTQIDELKHTLYLLLNRYEFENMIHYYDAFYLEKLSGLTSFIQQMISSKMRILNPIFTKSMIESSIGLPEESRRLRNFQRRLIVENNNRLNSYLVNGFKLVLPTPINLLRAKSAYGIRLLGKGINKLTKKELYKTSYIHLPSLLYSTDFWKKLQSFPLCEQLSKWDSNNSFEHQLNLISLNQWINKNL